MVASREQNWWGPWLSYLLGFVQWTCITLKYYVKQANTKDFSEDSESSLKATCWITKGLGSESDRPQLCHLLAGWPHLSAPGSSFLPRKWDSHKFVWGMNEGVYEGSRNQKLALLVSHLGVLKAVTDMQPWVPCQMSQRWHVCPVWLVFTTNISPHQQQWLPISSASKAQEGDSVFRKGTE